MEIKKDYLTANDEDLLIKIWTIYLKSFPITERRTLENIRECMRGEHCKIVAYHQNNILIGFIIYWEYKDFIYIEFFATNPAVRNSGYGSYILRDFTAQHGNLPLILEIDDMCDEISKRRCGFYQREGFVLNHFVHRPTAYNDISMRLDMHIMTYKQEISEELYNKFNNMLTAGIMSNLYK